MASQEPLTRNGGQTRNGAHLPRLLHSPTRLLALGASLVLLVALALTIGLHPLRPLSPLPLVATYPPTWTPTVTSTALPGAAVWATLEQRPLRLPSVAPGTECPLTPAHHPPFGDYSLSLGAGPVYAVGFGSDGTLLVSTASHFGAGTSGWGGRKLLWIIAPGNAGPVIVRGGQLGGAHTLRFNGGIDQQNYTGDWAAAPLLSALRLLPNRYVDPTVLDMDFVRLQASGCYAMQVDGLTFSEVIVFRAVMV